MTDDSNFAEYVGGRGESIRTVYKMVEVVPESLTIIPDNQRFADSKGKLVAEGQIVTAAPFGTAQSCDYSPARANIDLRGLPFQVSNSFKLYGTESKGDVEWRSNDQIVDVTGSGACGGMAPALISLMYYGCTQTEEGVCDAAIEAVGEIDPDTVDSVDDVIPPS